MQYKQDIYGMYSPDYDITTIMVDTYDENDLMISSEVVGWYHGQPNDKDNATFFGKLKCKHDW